MQFDPKPRCGGSVVSFTVMLLLIIGADFAVGRPDVRDASPFARDLQPPLLQPDVTFSGSAAGGGPKAIDSYGNPIDALRPIDTPDGRKVVSAQGVQFEIPTYASGITEIRRPADDLLPPHIGELTTTTRTTSKGTAAASGAKSRTETETRTKHDTKETNALTAQKPHSTNSRSSSNSNTNSNSTTRTALAAPPPPTISTTNKLAKRDSQGGQFPIAPPSNRHAPPAYSLIKLNPFVDSSDSPITQIGPSPQSPLCPPSSSPGPNPTANCSKYSTSNTNPLQPDAIAVGLESTDQKPIPIPNSFTGTASASSAPPAPLPATSLTPPHHDPPPPSTDTTTTTSAAAVAADVEVEQAQLVPLQEEQKVDSLPDYIRELQREDANIGGPVEWKPAADGAPLSVIAWDLLPPHQNQNSHQQEEQQQEPTIITEAQQLPVKKIQGIVDPITNNIRLSLSSGSALSPVALPEDRHQTDGPADHGTNAHVGSTTPSNPARFPNRQRGTAHYSTTRSSSTTLRPRSSSTTTTQATTTTTRRSTTTTTTRRPTTTTSTTTTTTTAKPETRTTEDPANFYHLGIEEAYAYTLPTWLQEVTDPDLDVAVTFEVPEDNDKYNHTLANDLEPPYEPFVDLGNIQLTPPPTSRPTTTTTRRTTTTTTTTTAAPTTTTTTTTTTTPRTTTTTTTRRPTTQRTTKAPIPPPTLKPPTQSTQAHPEAPPVKLTTTTTTTQNADNPTATQEDSRSTTASPLDAGNPFDSATIPAWLRDFDYPDVGPGVPFDPDNFGPAAGAAAASSSNRNPNNPPRPPTIPPASSAFPSKVTLPLPGSSSSSSSGFSGISSSEEPPLVLIPPADRSDAASSDSNPNPGQLTHPTSFAARFEPPASSPSSSSGSTIDPFPPSKVEYTKSDEGKVISTPINSNQRKTETVAPAVNTGKYTGGFGAPAGLLRPQSASPPTGSNSGQNPSPSANSDVYVAGNQHEFSSIIKANKARPTVNPGRYNGGFGAPTGVLSPQSPAEPRPFQPAHQQAEHREHQTGGGNRRTDSRFGGPPGILVPFDNVQRTGGQ
ncbi:hypothetical protein KR084_010690 [Drosophila pseudotakahashii]|nr:hypothetical protein KR084_010690 [Drosophila pseudotakahashii]